MLDNDQQGRDEYLVLTEKLCVPKENISFTDGTNIYNTRTNHCIENIFSKEDFDLYIDKPDYNYFKNNYSRDFMYKVKEEKVKMSNETIENFEKIIKQLELPNK